MMLRIIRINLRGNFNETDIVSNRSDDEFSQRIIVPEFLVIIE